jgi:IS30 family transposase
MGAEERRKIERWRLAEIFPDEMARVLGRHRSTSFRESRRNHVEEALMMGWAASPGGTLCQCDPSGIGRIWL